jgi:hypothetical protein
VIEGKDILVAMFEKIKPYLLPLLIAISALSVSASAAFYSVSGLSKLFAGASLQVIIMASSLEVAKLVIASLLYQYWNEINKALRAYLTVAAFVLILITSMGIYGFLSAAYQETANKAGNIDAQIALVETKRDNVRDQLTVYNAEKITINGAVADLQAGLANNVIQYTNAEGQLITTTSSSTRRALEKQLDQAVERQNELNTKIDGLNTQLFDYETEIVEIRTGNDLAGELGPLKYLSGLTGIPMDKIINYLLLTIIFVFDPLAISLVVAANFAFTRILPKTRENIYGEKVVIEEKDDDWDSTLNGGLEEEDNKEVSNLEDDLDENVWNNSDWEITSVNHLYDPETDPVNQANASIARIEAITKNLNSRGYFMNEQTEYLREMRKLKNLMPRAIDKNKKDDLTINY